MKGLLLALSLLTFSSVACFAGLTQDVGPRVGTTMPAFHWRDESGANHKLTDFTGYPVVLLPIYTRCPGPCAANVARLKETLSSAAVDPTQFRVLLFSFDPADTPDVLARYRLRERLPLNWSIGTGGAGETAALLESLGFQYGKAGREFTHPNMLLFLDGNLRLAKWIYGSQYSGRDLEIALNVARGGNDWIERHSDLLYALLLFGLSVSCVLLIYHLLEWVALRRTRNGTASSL